MTRWGAESCAHRQGRGGWAEDAELKRCAWPIGPRNTWSNAAYILAGFIVLGIDQDRPGLVMAVAMTILGVGSGLYHGLKTKWANRLDHVGMYLTLGALAVHGLPPHPLLWGVMAGFGAFLAVALTYVVTRVNLDVQMGLLLILAGIPAILYGSQAMAAASMGLFLVGYLAWQLDKAKKAVGLWGHAAWHIFTAVAIGLMYVAQIREGL